MKRHFTFLCLMVLLSVLMLTESAFSGSWTDSNSNETFSFTGTTVSTSTQQGGHGMTYYRVSGSADISGYAEPFEKNDSEYSCELWLMVSGDINSSAFPSKDNINENRIENGVNRDTHTSGAAKILYKSHVVTRSRENRNNPFSRVVTRSLSDSTSASYVAGSYSSPTGLSACPEVYGSLSGTLRNYVGSKSVKPLTFRSDANCAEGGSNDDGSKTVVSEICHRKQNCKLPRTATSEYSHRVNCPEQMWVQNDGLSFTTAVFGYIVRTKEPCTGFWWTCDDDPKDPRTVNICIWGPKHVKSREKTWIRQYVSPNGDVSQYPPNQSRSASVSGSSSSVSTYQSVSFTLSTTTAFSSVTWYVKSQGSSGLGSIVKTDNGSSSSYSASLSYSFSGSGDYVITAYIYDYSDGSTYQASATVTVSSSYGNNDNTPYCSYCTNSCSSCDGSSDDSSSDDSSDDSSSDDSSSGTTCSDCNHPYWEGGDAYNSPSLHETVTCWYCGESFKPCTNTAICYSNPSYGSNHSSAE